MAAPALIFGSGVILIGDTASPTDAFECQISEFTVNASANTGQIPGTYCQGPSQYGQASTYGVQMTFLQDWGETGSLSQLLWDNDGDLLYFIFTPDVSGTDCTGSYYAVGGSFGGAGDQAWTTTANMPCPAQPVVAPVV